MQPHQERVVTEKTELDEKIAKLNIFFDGSVYCTLPQEERDRLWRQARYMREYSKVLAERITAFPKE